MHHSSTDKSESQQTNGNRQAREYYRTASGSNGNRHCILKRATACKFLTKTADHKERIINTQTKAKQCCHIQDIDRQFGKMSKHKEQSESNNNRKAPHSSRQ